MKKIKNRAIQEYVEQIALKYYTLVAHNKCYLQPLTALWTGSCKFDRY